MFLNRNTTGNSKLMKNTEGKKDHARSKVTRLAPAMFEVSANNALPVNIPSV